MSIVLTLFPPNATRRELSSLLVGQGFKRVRGPFMIGPADSLDHFFWFEEEDFASTEGITAATFRPDAKIRSMFGCKGVALFTRTRAGASAFDLEHQNVLIREARKAFGGSFDNDCYGTNRYIPVEPDARSPAGRGIWIAYEEVQRRLDAITQILPDEVFRDVTLPSPFVNLIRQSDPARVLYNAILPSLVAAVEFFFKEAFVILLRYNPQVDVRATSITKKIDISDALAISRKELTIEEAIAGWYSFQRLSSIQTAYKDWLDIDMWSIFRAKRLRKRATTLDQLLETLIATRHGVVHRYALDTELSRKRLLDIVDTVLAAMDALVGYLEDHETLVAMRR